MTRIFENPVEAINEIERDIMEMGIIVHPHTMQNKVVKDDENFSTLEVQNYSFTILNMKNKNLIISDDSLEWVQEEFCERITKDVNPGQAYLLRKHIWWDFLNPEGYFDYTYSERINAYDQIDLIIQELKENPDTRQAIIHVHFPADILRMRHLRIPCSMYYQFMVRRGKLDIIYNMRSSDFDTHFKNDIWQADELRDYIANKVNIKPGLFHMNVGSLHRYKNYTKEHIF